MISETGQNQTQIKLENETLKVIILPQMGGRIVGYPFATGCRFEMRMTDYSAADFIEIFNNPELLYTANLPALMLWEKLVLEGVSIAATAGMDLHTKAPFEDRYATFIQDQGIPVSEALTAAIRSGQTWVSKGPLLTARNFPQERRVVFEIQDGKKAGCPVEPGKEYLMMLRMPGGSLTEAISPDMPLSISWDRLAVFARGTELCPVIPKLYEESPEPESLLCVSPVLHLPVRSG